MTPDQLLSDIRAQTAYADARRMANILRMLGFVCIALGAFAMLMIFMAAGSDFDYAGLIMKMVFFTPGLILIFAGFLALANAQTKLATLDASDIALATYAATIGTKLENPGRKQSYEDYVESQTVSEEVS